MLLKHGREIEIRPVERILDRLQGNAARPQEQDMLQPVHVRSVVDPVPVRGARWNKQPDLIVVAKRARTHTSQVGQFLGGVSSIRGGAHVFSDLAAS